MGELLAKFRLFPSVSRTEEIKKKQAQWGGLLNLFVSGVIFGISWSRPPMILFINLHWNPVKTSVYIKNCLGWSWIGDFSLLPWYLSSSPRKVSYKPATKWSISYLLLTCYFFCWRLTLDNVGRSQLPFFDWIRNRWKYLRYIPNIQRHTKENSHLVWSVWLAPGNNWRLSPLKSGGIDPGLSGTIIDKNIHLINFRTTP